MNIENAASMAEFSERIGAMPDEQLMAQNLIQQGAVHAITFLLWEGCTEATATDMLASLRETAELLRHEAMRRGLPQLFDHDRTAPT